MRVFVSFSGRDRKIKNALVEELRKGLAEGTEIWESVEPYAQLLLDRKKK